MVSSHDAYKHDKYTKHGEEDIRVAGFSMMAPLALPCSNKVTRRTVPYSTHIDNH